jgi:hypothetical protein
MLGDEQPFEIILVGDLRSLRSLPAYLSGIQIRRIAPELNTETHRIFLLCVDGKTSATLR